MDLKAFEKALEHLHSGKTATAKKTFQKLADNSDDPTFRQRCLSYVRACELRDLKQPEVDPIVRATALINDGQLEQAKSILTQLADSEPKNGTVWFTLACLHARMEAPDEAISALKRAIKLNPADRIRAANHPDFRNMKDRVLAL